ncbi:phospholipase D-like domain-containing protein [Rhizobium rhizogenes]|uniref:phospholipase D-like domain-containing protein n=1 Tax=Rhizobium rhizogenes TaxID=359 RepID=UPI00386E3866
MQPATAKISVCFTPAERCEECIVDEIDRARSSIRVQAYGFTSLPIIHALQRAAQRGLEVLAILDRVNERKYSDVTLREAAGIPIWIDFEPTMAHNKIIVIDGRLVIGGCYNFTTPAQKRKLKPKGWVSPAPIWSCAGSAGQIGAGCRAVWQRKVTFLLCPTAGIPTPLPRCGRRNRYYFQVRYPATCQLRWFRRHSHIVISV